MSLGYRILRFKDGGFHSEESHPLKLNFSICFTPNNLRFQNVSYSKSHLELSSVRNPTVNLVVFNVSKKSVGAPNV